MRTHIHADSCQTSRVLEVIYHLVNVTTELTDKKSHARFLSRGNSSTACASRVSLALSSICERFSKKYAATKAIASSRTASFQFAFAAFRWRALLSRLASCKSWSVVWDTSKRNSGSGMSFTGLGLSGDAPF